MFDFFRRKIHLVILVAAFILLVILSLFSDGYYGGADNITHYLISHYAFKYPYLFLNAWGRPLFTILSAPFAQSGLLGIKVMNILLGLLTAYYAFRIARMLKLEPAFLALVFVCFTPLYFLMMPTALTEILFSFVLMAAVFLFLRGNFIASAVMISFLPFARTEGYLLLPLFLLALVWARQYRAIPFLAAGIVVFSIAGSFYYNDIFWLFNLFPYPVTYQHPIYHETGSLWHFLQLRESILGLPLVILFISGIIGLVRNSFSGDKTLRNKAHLIVILAAGPFLLYLALHSVLYWQAMGGSMGLGRVMAAVMPMAALIALYGYTALREVLWKNSYFQRVFMLVIVALVLITPFRNNVFPFPLTPEERTIREATQWIRTSAHANRLVFYTDNNVPYYLGLDPYRKSPASCYLFGDARFLDTIPAGSLLVWDAHFGANESKVPLDSLLGNPRHRLVNYFSPNPPWITFGGHDYACYITLVGEPGVNAGNDAIRDSILDIRESENCLDTLLFNPFEQPADADPALLSPDIVHRGKFSFMMDGRTEYSPGLCLHVKDIAAIRPDPSMGKDIEVKRPDPSMGKDNVVKWTDPSMGEDIAVSRSDPSMGKDRTGKRSHPSRETEQEFEIRTVVYIFLPEADTTVNTLLVISFENNNQPYSYPSLNLNEQKFKPGRWNRVTLSAKVPAFKSPDDLVKVYIWNPGRQVFYLDDLRVVVISRHLMMPAKLR